MRKGRKKQILELLVTVSEALHYIKTTKNKDEKIMLENCLLCIETISSVFTDAGMGRTVINDKLKYLAQMLLCAQQSIENSNEFRKTVSQLWDEVAFIRHKVEKIQARLEIVFLPYKASMWDSMESVWRAAKIDENCDVYVIPIPYYDLSPNRSISRINYEGDLFPEEVIITDYREYNLLQCRPDIIYIHNPYDGYNYVTSILPEFYSDRLKQCTDMLVYIPYDVVVGSESDTRCRMPGVLNADRIIVQSERVKAVYAKYVSAEKVLALGSPKLEQIVWTQKHIPPMPKEWEQIVRGRKLVLYNTHLGPLFTDDGSVCKKLRYVFSCFAGRDDVCLLWRPHPLSQATMESMNPKPLREYMQLVEEYKRSGLGVYDDTADVHRAIALSAAYYGDMSSLVPMYEVTGKPMMMQNIDNDEEATPSFATYFVDGDTMWFTAFFFNGLFKMDMATKQISFVGKFPREDDQTWMYSKVMKVGHYLFFFPALATAVAVLNLETTKVKMYYLGDYEDGFSEGYRFFSAVLWGEWFYLLPLGGHVIVKMHVVSGEIQYESDWYEALRPYVKNEQGMLFSSVVQRGKYIWCPYCQANLIVRFDLETLEVKTYSVGKISNTYYNMNEGDSVFWLVTKEGDAVVRWNPETQETMEYRQLPTSFCKGEYALYWPIYHEGTVWVFPATGNRILKLNVETGEFSEHTDYPKNFVYEKGLNIIKYGAFENQNGIITAFPIKANMMLQIDATAGRTIGTELKWPEYHPTYFSRYLAEDCAGQKTMKPVYIYKENERFSSLKDYLDFVTGNKQTAEVSPEELFRKKMKKTSGNVGMNIHKKIKCLLNLVN